jgi:hypothetical protein
MYNGSLSGFSHLEDYVLPVCENPYVVISSLDVKSCLVNMNKWAFEDVPS